MAFVRRLFRQDRISPSHAGDRARDPSLGGSSLARGIWYVNLILLSQAVLAVGCILVVLGVSTAAQTPLWVFLAAALLLLSAVTLVYRKIRRRARELKQALDRLSLSDRQCEISLMDGMVRIHVFRGPPALKAPPRRLLDVGSAEEGSTQLQ